MNVLAKYDDIVRVFIKHPHNIKFAIKIMFVFHFITWYVDIDRSIFMRRKDRMEMQIEKLPAYTFAFMRQAGPYGAGNVQIMDALKSWAKSYHLLDDDAIFLGIPQDNPAATAPENCRYDACLVMAGPVQDEDVHPGSITGGQYAVFTIQHTMEAVRTAWATIFPELHGQGCQLDNSRPVIERYAARLVQAHLCEICVPIY